jgi:phospholipid transport system substrate-binding protein
MTVANQKTASLRSAFIVITAIAVIALTFSSKPVLAAGMETGIEHNAQTFIETISDKAINLLTSKDLPKAKRVANFRELFIEHFAVKGIGRWVLGRYWKRASEVEKEEYLGLFEDLMVVSYVDRFTKYTSNGLKIVKTISKRANTATVYSQIIQPGASSAIRVNWRVGSRDDETKVVDVVVEGTSLSNTLRSEFSSVIRRNGGSVSGLLAVLHKKTAALQELRTVQE